MEAEIRHTTRSDTGSWRRKSADNMRKRVSQRASTLSAESGKPHPQSLELARARQNELDLEERSAAETFHRVSEELAELHRQKYGVWHATWTDPCPLLRPWHYT